MPSITFEQLYTFHSMDREIFSKLLLTFMREPAECLLIIAIWLWLEEKGFPNIISRMVELSDPLIDGLADEAVSCLRCLESNNPPPSTAPNGSLPLTSRVMNQDISLRTIYETRFSAISGIKSFLNTVCTRIFADILQGVLGDACFVGPNNPLVIRGFPHPLFGNISIMPSFLQNPEFPGGKNSIWGWHVHDNVTENDRTMFLTFSRGFPVTEEEVRELFTGMFGEECVEGVHMQESSESNGQPLFAKMVLDSINTVDRVLGGRRIGKFRINGKHIWARKYERRDQAP